MGHPAKEGLRQFEKRPCRFSKIPRVGHPAKEGLRPFLFSLHETITYTQSGSSSKRGIKTKPKMIVTIAKQRPRVGHPAKEGLRQNNQR